MDFIFKLQSIKIKSKKLFWFLLIYHVTLSVFYIFTD